MPAPKLSLELPILLPQIEDERDQCVQRLQEELKQHWATARIGPYDVA